MGHPWAGAFDRKQKCNYTNNKLQTSVGLRFSTTLTTPFGLRFDSRYRMWLLVGIRVIYFIAKSIVIICETEDLLQNTIFDLNELQRAEFRMQFQLLSIEFKQNFEFENLICPFPFKIFISFSVLYRLEGIKDEAKITNLVRNEDYRGIA
jgi:hypothetical protein